MEGAVREVLPQARVLSCPVSDGGEGLVDLLVPVLGGRMLETEVSGPLPGQRVVARWGLSGDGTRAFIEMAQASGLNLVPAEKRDPTITTTYGVGELLRAALDEGASTILVGIGGSATSDGGAGMAEALGVEFSDAAGSPLPRGGAALRRLARIDVSRRDSRLDRTQVDVACDVQIPLVGPQGAAALFGPQKGASPEDVRMLDQGLQQYREAVRVLTGIDVQNIPGSGAAGGLGAGLVAFCGAKLKPGIDLVLDSVGFDQVAAASDVVLTGEGSLDTQTRYGKALSGVLGRCARLGKPVVAVVGILEGQEEDYVGEGQFSFVISLVREGTTKEAAMGQARELLRERTKEAVGRIAAAGGAWGEMVRP